MSQKKHDLIAVAKETQNIVSTGVLPVGDTVFNIKNDIEFSISYAKYFGNSFKIEEDFVGGKKINIKVFNNKAGNVGRELLKLDRDVLVLNFASAKHPGGSWLYGAKAQEEDLCRCSSLFSSLITQNDYYANNINSGSSLYTDDIIYSPMVPFFREDDTMDLCDMFKMSVITSPAPNVNNLSEDDEFDKLEDVIYNRAIKILSVANKQGHRSIVLGAWGCGVFGNDQQMIVDAFKNALSKINNFDNIYFAVYDPSPDQNLFLFFQKEFEGFLC
jgi:uncharacterized protein (TIGR02452 family)